MEQHATLKMLMDSLFMNNCLGNWSIFEDKSGQTVVNIRFTKNGNEDTVTAPQSFRRKSEAQAQRDRDRAARHRVARAGATTRSRAREASVDMTAVSDSPELPRHIETISVSNTASLEVSPVVELNPGAQCFNPKSVGQNSTVGARCTDENDSLISVESADTYNVDNISDDLIFAECPNDCSSIRNDDIVEEQSSVSSEKISPGIFNGKDIYCRRCNASYTTATVVYGIKMMHCDKCKVHICQTCYSKTRHFRKCKDHVNCIDT